MSQTLRSMLMPPHCIIPQELVDIVVDNLHSDKNALAVCSLVCRSWLPRARRHLFSAILIRHSNAYGFISSLTAPQSTIGNNVKILRLDLSPQDCVRPTDHNALIYHISRSVVLQTVKTLQLTSIEWISLSPDEERVFLSSFRNILSLSVSTIHFDGLQLIETLSSFPYLEELHLRDVYFRDELWFSTYAHLVASPYLRRLDVSTTPVSPIFKWLQRSQLTRLKTVALDLQYGGCPVANEFLKSLGPTIQELQLRGLVRFPGLDLGLNTGLHSLIFVTPRGPTGSFFDGVYSTFSTIRLSELKHLVFEFGVVFEDIPWSRLLRIFAHPQFSNVDRVSVHVHRGTNSAIDILRKHLDTWDRLNMLTITFPVSYRTEDRA